LSCRFEVASSRFMIPVSQPPATCNLQLIYSASMRLLISTVFLLTVLVRSLHCQYTNIVFNRLSVEEGFNGRINSSIIQDHLGFIWIAGVGIYKYDGYGFTHHLGLPGCSNCPPFTNYYIKKFVEDELGLLWMLTINGIAIYDPEKERTLLLPLTSIQYDSYNFFTGHINDILRDSGGNIWASDSKGLARISYNSRIRKPVTKDEVFSSIPDSVYSVEFLSLSPDIKSASNNVNCIFEDKWGNIWVGTRDGLFFLPEGTGPFIRIDSDDNNNISLSGKRIYDIVQLSDDTFWIATSSGLIRLTNVKTVLHDRKPPDISLMDFSAYMESNGPIRSLLKTSGNNLLVGTDLDLYVMSQGMDKSDFTFERVYKDMPDSYGYGYNNGVRDMMQDRTGTIWIVHDYGGIVKFNLDKSEFITYINVLKNNFSDFEISSLEEDKNKNLWAGTYGGGLYRINTKNWSVVKYNSGPLKYPVLYIFEYRPGYYLLGLGRGLAELNSSTGQLNDPFASLNSKAVSNLRKTQVNNFYMEGDILYISSDRGIFVYNHRTRRLLQATINNNDSVPDMNNQFRSILKSAEGELWAASYNKGLCRINYDEGNEILSLTPFQSSESSIFNIIDCPNISLHQDKNGVLWLGNGHLQKINLKTGEIKTFRLIENIDFIGVVSILEDDNRNLWLGTDYGLCRFDLKTETVKLFVRKDGWPIDNHSYLTAFKNWDGVMFFGGEGGFYSFHPDSIKINNIVPPVVITDLRLFNEQVTADTSGKAILNKNISYTQTLNISHNQNEIAFEFSALDYYQPMKNKYAYKLEGYQDEWIETDAQNRMASFTNLDPGKYTFMVKGSNSDGVWNEKGVSLSINIRSPWWSTLSAWIIYGVLFVLLLTAYIRWRTWHLKKEKKELEILVHTSTQQVERKKDLLELQNKKIIELDEVKSRFFTNISHEFRTPLSLIQGPVEELLDNPHRSEKDRGKLNIVYRNARRLLDLVNQLLDISKIDSSKMKLEITESDVMKYLRAITASFNSLAETRDVSYKCHFPSDQKVTWFDSDKCEKIVNNLLSNAFRFTPKGGTILFSAGYVISEGSFPLSLHFTVEDNGPGIPEASIEKIFNRFYQVEKSVRHAGGGTGIGLSLARDMARLMHGDINVASNPGRGSIFTVQFPLGREHLSTDEFTVLDELPESVAITRLQIEDVPPSQEPDEGSNLKKPVILLVEDNIDIRVQLADNFQSRYTIRHSSDGVVGFKKAIEIIPDLIITDLMMPFMDGLEMCTRLKNDERTSHIPVIMLTAKVTIEEKITGLQTGADDYVSKPFHMAELKARVENLINQRRKLRERFSKEISIQLSDITVTPLDEKFLKKAVTLVEQHLNDPHFDLTQFRNEMNMSGSTLFRKLHALTNQSPTEFIRTLRLKRAASLLTQNFGNITQVSLEVGFNNLSYFNKSFRKLFGVAPGEYLISHRTR